MKKGTVKHLSFIDKLSGWWKSHHTTRKAIETAFFAFVSGTAVALLNDPSLLTPELNTTWYVAIGILVLRCLDNWAKHNLALFKAKK